MNERSRQLLEGFPPEACICFDAEFARGMEMLELSIIDVRGRLMYQQRFKPRRYRTWSSEIHHITPEMVAGAPSFSSARRRIQPIIDRCRYVMGFAVRENDMAKMKRQYVQGLDSKRVLELRDWFWLCHGREAGLDYMQGISLRRCCEELGVGHDDGMAHSAAYDACVTLECFRILFDRFVGKYGAERKYERFGDVVAHFESVFKKYKHEYDCSLAAGYCVIERAGKSYLVKSSREFPAVGEDTVECIAVADRRSTMMALSERFTGTARARSFFFGRLTPDRLEFFRLQRRQDVAKG